MYYQGQDWEFQEQRKVENALFSSKTLTFIKMEQQDQINYSEISKHFEIFPDFPIWT